MEKILCACGCEKYFDPTGSNGNMKKYISGHANKIIQDNRIKNYKIPEKMTCNKCNVEKFTEEFVKHKRTSMLGTIYYRYEKICRECDNKKQRDFFKTKNGKERKLRYKDRKYGNIKYWVQNRLASWRALDTNCNLTTDYLCSLYASQSGLCYYTNKEMCFPHTICSSGISLDRLSPNSGYMIDNVVFCTYQVNTMKGQYTEKEFYDNMKYILNYKNQI